MDFENGDDVVLSLYISAIDESDNNNKTTAKLYYNEKVLKENIDKVNIGLVKGKNRESGRKGSIIPGGIKIGFKKSASNRSNSETDYEDVGASKKEQKIKGQSKTDTIQSKRPAFNNEMLKIRS